MQPRSASWWHLPTAPRCLATRAVSMCPTRTRPASSPSTRSSESVDAPSTTGWLLPTIWPLPFAWHRRFGGATAPHLPRNGSCMVSGPASLIAHGCFKLSQTLQARDCNFRIPETAQGQRAWRKGGGAHNQVRAAAGAGVSEPRAAGCKGLPLSSFGRLHLRGRRWWVCMM